MLQDKKIYTVVLLLGSILQFILSCSIHPQSNPTSLLSSFITKLDSLESLRANVTINNSISGILSYKNPANIHFKLFDGRIIASNGKTLWFYSPERMVTGKQELKGFSSGIQGLVHGYEDHSYGKTIKLKSENRSYSEIQIVVDNDSLPRSIRLVKKDDTITEILFSNITINLGLPSSLFNFQPPTSSIVVENPLNDKE